MQRVSDSSVCTPVMGLDDVELEGIAALLSALQGMKLMFGVKLQQRSRRSSADYLKTLSAAAEQRPTNIVASRGRPQ